MSTSAIPDVIDALVEAATDLLPDVLVSDGFIVSSQAGDYLMIGVEDADLEDAAVSAESVQTPATMGTNRSRTEAGSITCLAMSANGDGDPKAARDAVFVITAELEQLCRERPFLDIAVLQAQGGGLQFGANHSLMQGQDENGASAAVVFSIGFTARL